MKVKTTDMVWGVSSMNDLREYAFTEFSEHIGWTIPDSGNYPYDTAVKTESLRSELIKELLNV